MAGCVIASHYAEAVERELGVQTALHAGPSATSETISALEPGDPFAMLDDSLGWAWGYAGSDRRVGYVVSESLANPG